MAGNHIGGLKAAETLKKRQGEDFYSRIGKKGGASGTGHAYGHGKVDPRENGAKGGSLSKRGYKFIGFEDGEPQYVKN